MAALDGALSDASAPIEERDTEWGPGPWNGPRGGSWWIFPLIALVIVAVFVRGMIRAMSRGGGVVCMGGHRTEHGADAREELEALRREVRELREAVRRERRPVPSV